MHPPYYFTDPRIGAAAVEPRAARRVPRRSAPQRLALVPVSPGYPPVPLRPAQPPATLAAIAREPLPVRRHAAPVRHAFGRLLVRLGERLLQGAHPA